MAQESGGGNLGRVLPWGARMSAQAPAVGTQAVEDARLSRRSTTSLVVAVLLLVLVCLLVLSGLLVRLDNDRNGKSLLPSTVAPGGSVGGELSLTNRGLLPVEFTLEPRLLDGTRPSSIPSRLAASVQRTDDGEMLYDGPMRDSMGPLQVLQPGESVRLRVTITANDPHSTSAVPLAYNYYWNAHAALPWWWWLPLLPIIAVLVAVAWWRPRHRMARR